MFEKVQAGVLSDIRILKEGQYDGNSLFAKRILGNPQPENGVLGALVMDSQQAGFLAGVLDSFREQLCFEDGKDELAFANMHDAVRQLYTLLYEIKPVK